MIGCLETRADVQLWAVCRYFLWRFSILCSTLDFLTDSYTWPLLVYMLLVCVYPFTSSCAHTFSTMSPESRHICYFFDYGALSLYSLGRMEGWKDGWVDEWVGGANLRPPASSRLRHQLRQLHHPRQLDQQLAAAQLRHHRRRELALLHRSVLLLPVRPCGQQFQPGPGPGPGPGPVAAAAFVLCRFLEQRSPQRSKLLRTGAFVLPFLFDSVPLFYRVSFYTREMKNKHWLQL